MKNIPTAHNECKNVNEIAKIVLMPGDPLRAKFIAETFLTNVKMFNKVRNIFGYTGYYNGKLVSVMASGMGMPSIGIYSYELYKFYGVEEIIRVGSAGSYSADLEVFDTVLVSSAYSDSSFAKVFDGTLDDIIYPSKDLNERIKLSAKSLNINLKEARIYSSDVFYNQSQEFMNGVKKNDCKAVEMESFALFTIARNLNKKAACLLTISDSFVSHKVTTSEEREKNFTDMMKIALNI